MKILSTPQRARRVIAAILTGPAPRTGVYYDESGAPMTGSSLVPDTAFQDRVVAQTQAFLAQGKMAAESPNGIFPKGNIVVTFSR